MTHGVLVLRKKRPVSDFQTVVVFYMLELIYVMKKLRESWLGFFNVNFKGYWF